MTVLMSKPAYLKFLKFVVEHAHPFRSRHTWQEVIGFIFGRFNPEPTGDEPEVYITDVLPMDSGSSVYVKVGDYSTIYPTLMEKMENNEFVVGWIHSHPGLGIFLSGTDVNTQAIYQQMDGRSIAIVVDHTKISQSEPGLKCFRITPDKFSYNTIPIAIEDINNFSFEYQSLANILESELKIIKPQFSDFSIAKIGNIELDVLAPKTWKKEESFQIIVNYKTDEIGFVKLQYTSEITGGNVNGQHKVYNRHKVYNSGIVGIFQVKSGPQASKLVFQIKEIQIINNQNEKISPDPVTIEIAIT